MPILVRIAPFLPGGCPPGIYAGLARLSAGCPPDKGRLHTCYSPVRHSPAGRANSPPAAVRLACVKPAASVHPEPGSNSPLLVYHSFLFSTLCGVPCKTPVCCLLAGYPLSSIGFPDDLRLTETSCFPCLPVSVCMALDLVRSRSFVLWHCCQCSLFAPVRSAVASFPFAVAKLQPFSSLRKSFYVLQHLFLKFYPQQAFNQSNQRMLKYV